MTTMPEIVLTVILGTKPTTGLAESGLALALPVFEAPLPQIAGGEGGPTPLQTRLFIFTEMRGAGGFFKS